MTAAETRARLLTTTDADEAARLFTHAHTHNTYEHMKADEAEWFAFVTISLCGPNGDRRSLDGSAAPCRDPDSIKAWTTSKVVIWNGQGGYIAVPRERIIQTRNGSWRLAKVA